MNSESVKKYTVGFIFNQNMDKVLLVHKTKPEWQAGKLNGIGGKFEKDETMFDCIVRETQEESTLNTTTSDWQYVGTLFWPGKEIYVLTCIYPRSLDDAKQNDYEHVEWFGTKTLPSNILENLNWLIPMSQQTLLGFSQKFSNHDMLNKDY